MAAITFPIPTDSEAEVRGARARAAAVRSRAGVRRPALFSGDGQLRRKPVAPVPFRGLPLVAHDDLALLGRDLHAGRANRDPKRAVPTAAERPSAATYRRRRAAVAAILLGTLLAGSWALGFLGGGSLAASGAKSSSTAAAPVALHVQPVSRSTYVVEPGDTLWSIARQLQPTGDVRPVVDALATARHGRPLEVGERIVLP